MSTILLVAPMVRRWLQALREQRRRVRERDALAQLDRQTLRDLGIGAGELASIQAEASGEAQRTRLRLALWRSGAAP